MIRHTCIKVTKEHKVVGTPWLRLCLKERHRATGKKYSHSAIRWWESGDHHLVLLFLISLIRIYCFDIFFYFEVYLFIYFKWSLHPMHDLNSWPRDRQLHTPLTEPGSSPYLILKTGCLWCKHPEGMFRELSRWWKPKPQGRWKSPQQFPEGF